MLFSSKLPSLFNYITKYTYCKSKPHPYNIYYINPSLTTKYPYGSEMTILDQNILHILLRNQNTINQNDENYEFLL